MTRAGYPARIIGPDDDQTTHTDPTLAEQVGLNGEAFRSALIDGTYAETHQMLLRVAYEQIPVTAVPTFLIGNRLLRGLVPVDGLIEQLRAAQQDPAP